MVGGAGNEGMSVLGRGFAAICNKQSKKGVFLM